MNCKECLSIVEEYVENSLDLETFNHTAEHIFACARCRLVYEELKNEQEMYSRYLLKIKERPNSWEAVRTAIRKSSSVAPANAGTAGAESHERLSALFFRQPLFGAVAVLVLIIGIGFAFWYRPYFQKDCSSNIREGELPSEPKKNDPSLVTKDAQTKSARDEAQILKKNKDHAGQDTFGTYSTRPGNRRRRAESIDPVTLKGSSVSFDSSEAAFNRHIEKCEMVLRSFRNAVSETYGSGFDISYERRLSKELLNNSVKFRREAQSQGNLPIENLLVDLEAILGDIIRLRKNATSSDANLIKGRIQESLIIPKLQIQSSIAETSD